MNAPADRTFVDAAIEALGLPPTAGARLRFEGPDSLPSAFAATALASAAIGAAALAISELVAAIADAPPVVVDRRLASLWFGTSIRPVGWTRFKQSLRLTDHYSAPVSSQPTRLALSLA